MIFTLTEDQAILKDTLEKFVQDRYGDNQRRTYRGAAGGYSLDNWRDLAELGLLGLALSDAGGLDTGPRELVAVMEVLGGGLVVEPMLEEIVFAAGLLARAGDAAQKQAWLPRVIAGTSHLAVAHFEHQARFMLSDVRVSVRSRDGEDRLHGTKILVPLAAVADRWIVSARRSGAPDDPAGIEFFLIAPDSPGIERRDFRLIDGSVASSVTFDDARATDRLPGGFACLAEVADTVRIAAGAEMVGVMSTIFASTLDYLRTRKQFGAPLASFQALQHRLADLYVMLEQSRSQVLRAAVMAARGVAAPASVAAMKSYVSRAAVEVGEECVHLHGGIGTTDELSIGHGYKRLLLLANLLGDSNSELTRFIHLAKTADGAAA